MKCALFTFDAESRSLARETIESTASSGVPGLLEWIDAHPRVPPSESPQTSVNSNVWSRSLRTTCQRNSHSSRRCNERARRSPRSRRSTRRFPSNGPCSFHWQSSGRSRPSRRRRAHLHRMRLEVSMPIAESGPDHWCVRHSNAHEQRVLLARALATQHAGVGRSQQRLNARAIRAYSSSPRALPALRSEFRSAPVPE